MEYVHQQNNATSYKYAGIANHANGIKYSLDAIRGIMGIANIVPTSMKFTVDDVEG
jgi:hypothetical protein